MTYPTYITNSIALRDTASLLSYTLFEITISQNTLYAT